MLLSEYHDFVRKTTNDRTPAVVYPCLGLAGEIGEVIELVKKATRGDFHINEKKTELMLEMGDVLWYLTRLANDMGFTLEDIMSANVEKLTNRRKYGKVVEGAAA